MPDLSIQITGVAEAIRDTLPTAFSSLLCSTPRGLTAKYCGTQVGIVWSTESALCCLEATQVCLGGALGCFEALSNQDGLIYQNMFVYKSGLRRRIELNSGQSAHALLKMIRTRDKLSDIYLLTGTRVKAKVLELTRGRTEK